MHPFEFKSASDREYRFRHIPGEIGAEALEYAEYMAEEAKAAEQEGRNPKLGRRHFETMLKIFKYCVVDKNGEMRYDDEQIKDVAMPEILEVGMHIFEATFASSTLSADEADKPGESLAAPTSGLVSSK